MEEQKISIITINYNNLGGLKKTRESIAVQTYKNYEWIVIDGGSTDGSKDFIYEHANEMSYWCSEKDTGIYNAQNKGTRQACGEYSIYMNSGDVFYNQFVLEYVFNEPRIEDVIYGDWVQVFPDGKRKCISPSRSVNYAFFLSNNICHQAIFVKTSLIKESPYDETYNVYADWVKWTEFAYKGMTFKYIDYRICNFMMGGICSENENKHIDENNRRIEKFYPGTLRSMVEKDFVEQKARSVKHLKQLRWLIYINIFLLLSLIFMISFLCSH